MDIRIDNRELGDVLASLGSKARALGGIMPAVAEILKSGVDDVFEAEGPGWKDLAESTKQARRGSSYKILQDTGLAAGSIGVGSGPDWAEASAGVAYLDFHSRGNERLPRRDAFDLGPFLAGVLDEASELILRELT